MAADPASTRVRSVVSALARYALLACVPSGCAANERIPFKENTPMVTPWGETPALSCDMSGTWVTFVEVGVDWSSETIKEGSGKLIQWILSERQPTATGALDRVRSCGIGAKDVELGSAWFSTRAFPAISLPEEWTGVEFLPELFDNDNLPERDLPITMSGGNPGSLRGGEWLTTALVPFEHGVENVPDDVWPAWRDLGPFLVDHDEDGKPGLTGFPFTGPVPGTDPVVEFKNPRLDVDSAAAKRTNALYMAIRTRAQLEAQLVSCDPPTFVGSVVTGTLLIETANVGCNVAESDTQSYKDNPRDAPCSDTQANFIDFNLPDFRSNGVGRTVSIKAPPNLTCARAREWIPRP